MRQGHTPEEQNWAPQWTGSHPGSGPRPVPMKSSMMQGIVIRSEQVLKNWRACRRRHFSGKSMAFRIIPMMSKPPLGRGRLETVGPSVVGRLLKKRNPPSSSSSSPTSPPDPSTSSLAGEDAGAAEVVDASVLDRSGVGVVDVVVVLMAAVLLLLLLLVLPDDTELAARVEFPLIMVISVVVVEFAMLASICMRVLEVGAVVVTAALPNVVAVAPAASDWAGAGLDVAVVAAASEVPPPRLAIRPPPPMRKDCSSHGWYIMEHMSSSWRTQIR